MSIIIAILVFSIIVLVHELGHFVVAVKAGILVEEFAMGMGPRLFAIQKGDTLYSIRLFPIGGFCKMLGEDEKGESDERAFHNKGVAARIAVICAGVVLNFLLSFVILVVLSGINGFIEPVVESVNPGLPAEAAQLQPGDRIVSLNGKKINIYEDLSFALSESRDLMVNVVIQREGRREEKTIIPVYDETLGRYIIGFRCQMKAPLLGTSESDLPRAGLLETLRNGYHKIFFFVRITLKGILDLFTFRANMDDMSGFIGIVQVIGETYTESIQSGVSHTVQTLSSFVAILSANLAVFNLLPLPALDGGRLVFLLLEAIRRKPVSPEKEGMVHFIGFIMLMILAILVAYNDIMKIL